MTNEAVLSPEAGRIEELILSFRSMRSESVLKSSIFLRSMLAEHGFVLESHQVVRRQVTHSYDLDVARRLFNEDITGRGQQQLGPLPKEVITRLTRIVKLHVFEFSMVGGRERATLTHCERNWYPAISMEIWYAKRPRYPAGFLTLRGVSRSICDAIRHKMVSRAYS